jgi:ABC-type nitrate/sulfonate/bicarbonate transport system substrate-binding protein
MRLRHWIGVALLVAMSCGFGDGAGLPPAGVAVPATPGPTAVPPLERFRYGYPATSLGWAYLLLGEAQGLYQREGLAPELIQIAPAPLLAALSAGEVDYSAGGAGGIRLAIRDQPVRLLSTVSLQNFTLVARPEIESGSALRGKIVGTLSRGSAGDQAFDRALRRFGLDPEADVTKVVTGDQPVQAEALRSNRVQALVTTPPLSVQAEREGYRILANTADFDPAVGGGVVTTLARLASSRERTKRLLRAEYEIVRYLKSQPAETIAFITSYFGMSPEDAAVAYRQALPYYWDRLELHTAAVEATIAAEREVAEITAAVTRDQVVDATLLEELRASASGRP